MILFGPFLVTLLTYIDKNNKKSRPNVILTGYGTTTLFK
ncbi:putative holin-like toxin [Levilactobacillus brevis]